jgi:TolB-like protein/class 3 adenylate cyclase/Tfp pilus assembly protein PilF
MSTDRRLAAIMFTDLVGYSAIAQQDETLALRLLQEHQQLLRPIFAKFNGQEIKTTGDGFLIEFASAIEAVKCAIEIQGDVNTRNASATSDNQINVRIGIHMGEVERRDGDIYGNGVNVAARIEPLAEAGGICVSATVYDLVKAKVEVPFISLGTPEMKNIQELVEVFKVELPWSTEVTTHALRMKLPRLTKVPITVFIIAMVIVASVTWWAVTSFSPSSITPLPPGEITSIAVLPFQNLSSDEENEYFSDGISEEILNALVKIEGLRVPGRTSSFSFKDKDMSIKQIADLLSVDAILEGSVRKSGDRVRITAQFVRASDDTRLWSETFERELGDIFDVQEEIAESILIKLGHSHDLNQQIVRTGTTNTDAYNLYLEGKFFLEKRTIESINISIDLFERSLELDENNAHALSGLADAYSELVELFALPPEEGYFQATGYAERAIQLDPELVEAVVSLATIKWFTGRAESALEDINEALEIAPNHPMAIYRKAAILTELNEGSEESIRLAIKALSFDPLSLTINRNLAVFYIQNQDFEKALVQAEKTLLLDPNLPRARQDLANIKRYMGDWKGAEAEYKNLLTLHPEYPAGYTGLAELLLMQGKYEEGIKFLDQAIEHKVESPRFFNRVGRAYYFAHDFEKALEFHDYALGISTVTGDIIVSSLSKAMVMSNRGNYVSALELIETVRLLDPENDLATLSMSIVQARMGDVDSAKINLSSVAESSLLVVKSIAYAVLTEYDSALAQLENALLEFNEDIYWLKVHPDLQALAGNDRFSALISLLGL